MHGSGRRGYVDGSVALGQRDQRREKYRKEGTGGLTGYSSLADRKACAGVPNKRDIKRQLETVNIALKVCHLLALLY